MKEPFQLTIEEFEKYMNFIETESPVLSIKHGVLGKKDSYRLNQLLTLKNTVNTPNKTQDSYQSIDLMYRLALNGKLYYKGNKKGGKPALIETDTMQSFKSLNLYEKYVYLQQTYWTYFDLHKMFDGSIRHTSIHDLFAVLSSTNPNQPITKDQNSNLRCFFDGYGVFFHHLRFFGIGEIVEIPNVKSRYDDCIQAFIPNEFGIKFSNLIFHTIIRKSFPKTLPKKELLRMLLFNQSAKCEVSFETFKNLFPKNLLQNTIIPENQIDRSGVYTFKVSLSKDCWRKIRISHQHTLSDLHFAIQDAFEFDNDHLYGFYINGNARTGEGFLPEYAEDENKRKAEKTTIADVGLYKGQKMLYIFDFGDNWEFSITLEKIEKAISYPDAPMEIDRKGDAPKQYHDDWD